MRIPSFVTGLLIPVSLVAQSRPTPPPGFDAFVAAVMKQFEVPGMGIAIVKDGQVVLAKGHGVRKLETPPRSMLVPVRHRLEHQGVHGAFAGLARGGGETGVGRAGDSLSPGFQLWDPWTTRELTVRDLLVHRSGFGLGAGDLLWWPPSTYNRNGNRRPAQVHQARDQFPHGLRLRQRAVPRRGPGDRSRLRKDLGSSSSPSASCSRSAWPDSTVLSLGCGRQRRRGRDSRAKVDGMVRPIAPFLSDNTNPAGGINSARRGHGQVGHRAARLGGGLANEAALEPGYNEGTVGAGHADRSGWSRRRNWPRGVGTSTATRWGSA